MSGLVTNITGFTPPTSLSSFLALLQNASYNGVPFHVIASQIRKGRKVAVHNYPFRDGGWAEDMGRALRTYSFTGYLIGDIASVLQLALDTVVEKPGPGLLIHPSVGAQMVSVLSYASSIRKEAGRVIEVAFEFIEQGSQGLLMTLIATAVEVLSAASDCLSAIGDDLGSDAGPAAAAGNEAVGEGVSVVTSFGTACIGGGNDPAGVINLAAGLQTSDSTTSYGRYAFGNASTALATGTTVALLQSQITVQRASVAADVTTAEAAAATFEASTAAAAVAALAQLVEDMRSTMTDPADQVRVLLNLATFSFSDGAGGTGLAGDMATVRDAMSAACRRVALISLARATAAYQPISYQDAQNIITLVTAALDIEITAAGDAEDDETYNTMRNLRASVVRDLSTRGATLPQVITVTFGTPLPSLVVAQILYQDASRSDQITLEANPPHPAFCPVSFQALSA